MFKQTIVLCLLVGLVAANDLLSIEEQLAYLDKDLDELRALAQDQQQAKEQLDQGEVPKVIKQGLGESLLDLAIIGGKTGSKAFKEVKPHLGAVKNALEQHGRSLQSALEQQAQNVRESKQVKAIWDRVSNNQHLKRGLEMVKPHAKAGKEQMEKLGKQLKPIVDQGLEKAKPIIEQNVERLRPMLESAQKKTHEMIEELELKKKEILEEHEQRQAALKKAEMDQRDRLEW